MRACQRLLLGCLALLLIGAPCAAAEPRRVPDTMAERVRPCTGCHGKEGRATGEGYFPRIAGKPAGYLYNQLVNFRDGRRNYPLMVYLLEHMSDDYLRAMAQYFAALELPYPAPQPAQLSQPQNDTAVDLVRRGDAARKLPACASCHGGNLLGVNPGVPGLLGLSRFYIYAQLNQWKNGTRRAHAPDCMATIAAQLTPAEVGTLAAWLAAQPAPPAAAPATGFDQPPPLACGSVPQ